LTPPTLGDGRYRLERRLGLGGMAVIHLAHDALLDRRVAIKLLAERFRADTDLRERFLREGRFAARLSHPNVVAVFDTGEEDAQPYIVMEYVQGASLAEELARRHTFAAEEVAQLGRQASFGLAHAHAAGLVHRDVKPQNLLLRADGTLKVADFGIARGRAGETITEAGTLLGTVQYMAPEVAGGEDATAAADVYSLGAVLYELLTGRSPRTIRNLADLTSDVAITNLGRLVPDAPAWLVGTIMRCLDADPRLRPSAEELTVELGDASEELPTRKIRPALRMQRTGPGRRLWVTVGVLGLAVLAGIGLGLRGDDEQGPCLRHASTASRGGTIPRRTHGTSRIGYAPTRAREA